MRAKEFIFESIGSVLDLTKNYPQFSKLQGKVLDISPKGKYSIQIVSAELLPGKKSDVKQGSVLNIHKNYLRQATKETLTPDNISILQKAKDQIQKNKDEELAAWTAAVEKNYPQWLGSKAGAAPQEEPEMPIPAPQQSKLEPSSVLKARLDNLNAAIEKKKLLDKYIKKAEANGLLSPTLQFDTDVRNYIKDADKDDYKSLNAKLDQALQTIQKRLYLNKIAFRKRTEEDV